MNNPFPRLSLGLPKIRAGLASALGRFPWVLLCGLAGTLASIESLREDTKNLNLCGKIAMTAALGMPLFFSLRIVRERIGDLTRAPLEIVGLPVLAGWFFSLPRVMHDGPGIVYIRWGLLLAALHFAAAVSAYLRQVPGDGFWQFNRRIFLRFCLATLYTCVLTIGLELALLSADKLFELKLEKSYLDLFYIMIGCFHPAFFLAGVPRDFAELEVDSEYPRGLKAFTQFVLAPLVAAYTAILYAYALKIVIARTWPHGWVALPVLILSGVGILSALLLHPLRTRHEQKWAVWFCRNFPRALAPLALLLLLSLWQRIDDYGVTEERYLGLVSGAWIFAWATIFIFKKEAGIRWIPASLAVICLLTAFGPWSAGAVSKESQLRRLTHLLEAHNLMADGKILVPATRARLPSKDYEDIQSTIRYLITTHGGETIRGLFGGLVKETDWTESNRWYLADKILGSLDLVSESGTGSVPFWHNLDPAEGVTVEGFKRVSFFEALTDGGGGRTAGPISIQIKNGALEVVTVQNAPPQPVPLDALLESLEDNSRDLPPERMTVDWQRDGQSFRIIFTHITIRHIPGQPARLENCSLLFLEK
jgi:hypothetical protein